ncbi:type II methionyl aminopeptidase [Candidatus Bathyarchaeota archaeon]|jgi:methionyl aminopeptidase|nr:type II methionyl aminopeptidase [Candidatus Bathyarchaeota archaeon]MBT4320772.1 type II methionyl aminopeptidase [Candidatus Bathyarchaeota archaeon]MBT4422950.1 type II methionyl aminopeptidase [Candidatus Bathyarchaeota archaeon]MBT5642327.1 type II methionyl aminopeptidase [Candidatus Bathyarchaeota archaeon]MBT6605074.1 type II methionyl aminopeptidase [Candidatus Bathyarchaeota archaeon]
MDPLDALREAGRIAAKVRDNTIKEIEPGIKIVDICDVVNRRVAEQGAKMAFPTNVDINHVAAHYCSPINDKTVIPEKSLVKLDIGVHVDGYIADTAVTKCFDSEYEYLVEAAKAGLDAAIQTIRPGIKANVIGSAIENAINGKGARPISNLTGHKLARYVVHCPGYSIPNVGGFGSHTIQEGDVYAIEPFAVPRSANGQVTDGPPSNIYLMQKKRNVKGRAKIMMKFIQSEYKTLPFASRWVLRKFKGSEGEAAFKELLKSKVVTSYPQLLERTRGMVAQAEHSVIVTEDGCEVTTV